jgi:hypothetical protein
MSRQPLLDALESLGKDPDDNVRELARRYQNVFCTTDAQLVMEDLKRKFWFYDSTAGDFVRENEGNRQVILYILGMMVVDTNKSEGDNDNGA